MADTDKAEKSDQAPTSDAVTSTGTTTAAPVTDAPGTDVADETVEGPVDGRTARAVRTREAIVDATIALLAENDVRPSAPRIAERAGVSVRSVFQHFDDLETLYAAVGARARDQVMHLIHHIDASRPLDERILELVHQRALVNEALTPTLRAAVVHAPGSRTINHQFQSGHELIGIQLGQVFSPELEAAGDRRQLVLDSLVAISSWSLWNSARNLNRLSLREAERMVVHLAACILGPIAGRDLTPLTERVLTDEPTERFAEAVGEADVGADAAIASTAGNGAAAPTGVA